MNVNKYEISFNDGLGIFPVSLFVELEKHLVSTLFEVWDKIQEYECRDIIFYGDIQEYIKKNFVFLEALNFLTSRLVGAGFHTSVILNSIENKEILQKLIASRLIVFFTSDVKNSTYFRERVNFLAELSNNDIIIMYPKSLKEFLFVRSYFIEKKIKAKVLLESAALIRNKDFIDNKIYDIGLYKGESYV